MPHFHSAAVLILGLHAAAASPSPSIHVDWGACPLSRSTASSILVAADPEWTEEGVLSATAVSGVRMLSRAGADNIRLLNFNIFPMMSCAQLEEGVWNFTRLDQVVVPFLESTLMTSPTSQVILDIETSPQWMWLDAGACVPLRGPHDASCDDASAGNKTCADATGTGLPPMERRRCPHWGDTTVPRDTTYTELSAYFARIAMWYTRGGFIDERGRRVVSPHRYDEKRITWEVWNEINSGREHNVTVADYIRMYDAQVAALTTGLAAVALPDSENSKTTTVRPWQGRFSGPSLMGLNNVSATQWFGALLDQSQHSPPSTRLDGITFHQYSNCHNTTPAGLEPIFSQTVLKVKTLAHVEQLRNSLRPGTRLHLTESGITCNSPPSCNGNDYSCYYTTKDFTRDYWVASAAQWTYQFFLSTRTADLATVAQSQILGYPAGFDGLSGEWPCGSMVDWAENKLNHKLWVQIAMLEAVDTKKFSFCDTTRRSESESEADTPTPGSAAAVFAQGVVSAKGHTLVLINTKATATSVSVPGAAGKTAATIDARVGNEAPRTETLKSDEIELGAFATMFVRF